MGPHGRSADHRPSLQLRSAPRPDRRARSRRPPSDDSTQVLDNDAVRRPEDSRMNTTTVPARLLTVAERRQWDEYGYLHIRSALNSDEVAHLRGELMDLHDATDRP